MASTAVNGRYEICYETFGDPGLPTLLLVNGFTSQMIRWPVAWCEQMVAAGFHVVRYDNRDVGLSTKTDDLGVAVPDVGALATALRAGDAADVPYSLSDMAADGMAVLDALGIDAAHVAGMSMGGMIVQVMAIEHPQRVLSLTSIMSTTGDRSVGQATPEAMASLQAPPPPQRDDYVAHTVETGRVISGSHYDEAESAVRAAESYDRCFHPQGNAFQMAAIMATPDRTGALGQLAVPTVVIHGALDPLIQLDGGEATASAVPGAELVVLDTMGHDWPEPLWPDFERAISGVAARAAA